MPIDISIADKQNVTKVLTKLLVLCRFVHLLYKIAFEYYECEMFRLRLIRFPDSRNNQSQPVPLKKQIRHTSPI